MLNALVRFSLRHRVAVVTTSFLLLALACYHLQNATFDVFPEFAPPQVIIQTEAPGFSSDQVETLVTQIVEQTVGGANGVTAMQSSSIQDLSAVQVFFDLHSNILIDRQVIAERLADIAGRLPQGVKAPRLTPLASTTDIVAGIGLTSDTLSQTQLRTIADWQLRPQLLGLSGVADAESYGGLVRQVQIQLKPDTLRRYGLSYDDVLNTARLATGMSGAGVIDDGPQRLTLNVATETATLDSLARTPLTRGAGEALDLSITLGDVADIVEGHATPFSGASIMGKPGVLLLVTSQYGSNTLEVTRRLERLLGELRPSLQKQGIDMRSDLIRPASFIETSVGNIQKALLTGATLVTVTLFLFLWNWRAAVISALAIPFSLITAAALLDNLGITLNTMSLGGLAIAVGLVVDDAVIDVENMLRHLRENRDAASNKIVRYKLLLLASLEVRVPVIFATFAVVLISIPIMTMSGLGGRLFAPLGYAYAVATLLSLLVALTLTPALSMMFLQEKNPEVPRLTRWLQAVYIHVLQWAEKGRFILYGLVLIPLVIAGFGLTKLKSEFIPVLHEGHFIVHMEAEPGTSLDASMALGKDVTTKLLALPFIDAVVQQVGRTENGIDFWGTNSSEFNVALKPNLSISEETAKEQIDAVLAGCPDAQFEVETFLTERMQEIISGHTAMASLNIYGDNLHELEKTAEQLAGVLEKIPNVTGIERAAKEGAPELKITLKNEALLKWGLDPVTVLNAIHTAYQGDIISQIYDQFHPTDVAVILNQTQRGTVDAIDKLPILSPSGDYVPLGALADITQQAGRYLITHENGRRVQAVTFNIERHSMHKIMKNIRLEIARQNIPAGVYTSIVSLTDEAVNAHKQLLIHSTFAGFLIIILLSFVMTHPSQLMLILANAPLAVMGGIIALMISGDMISLGAIVGFITLVGITLRNSVLMLSHYAHVVQNDQWQWNAANAYKASAERLLPILMTAIVTGIGLLPLVLNRGASGHEIEGPMALVIIGGLISSTVLNLVLLPILSVRYGNFENKPI